jgi:hypothetical protein
MEALSAIDGMVAAMEQRVRVEGIPFLGIRTSGPARPAQLADTGGDKPCTQAESLRKELDSCG